jgi:glucose-6-phosphate isomerase
MEIQTGTSFIQPFAVALDLDAGTMRRAKRHLVRRASDMRGHYADPEALEALARRGNPVHYEVFEVPVPEEYGHLMYCISTLQPGRVGAECFMTKGHYHTRVETAEIYLCLRGEGFLLMKTSGGEGRAERMERGRMVYVPPYWAHRSVNTGRGPLVSFCVYPGEAGHNYGDIETEGFPLRVCWRRGKAVLMKAGKVAGKTRARK